MVDVSKNAEKTNASTERVNPCAHGDPHTCKEDNVWLQAPSYDGAFNVYECKRCGWQEWL